MEELESYELASFCAVVICTEGKKWIVAMNKIDEIPMENET